MQTEEQFLTAEQNIRLHKREDTDKLKHTEFSKQGRSE